MEIKYLELFSDIHSLYIEIST